MRPNVLDGRHRALGADDSVSWNDMVLPQRYKTSVFEEVVAVRARAGLFDVSAVKIINISGPDAVATLDYLVTADVAGMKPGAALIGAELNDEGAIIDDIMIIRDGADRFRISHGTGVTPVALAHAAKGKTVTITPDNERNVLSLQGPASLAVLAPHTPAALKDLAYFHHVDTTLFGVPVNLLRGGYSGELGYEVYCEPKDAVALWDKILEAGKSHGVIPVSWDCLDTVRVEAALLFFPFEMPHQGTTTPWETNQEWALDLNKPDFRGKQAVLASKGKERTKVAGITIDCDHAVTPGSKLFSKGVEVGIVTSTTYSQFLMLSVALVALKPGYTALGTEVEVADQDAKHSGRVVQIPFYDPLRRRTYTQN